MGKILNFSILSFGCRRGTGTPGPGRAQAGQKGHERAPVPGHHAPAEHVRALPQGPALALGKGHQRALRHRRGDGIAGSRSARSTSARVRVRAVGLVLGLGSGLGLGLELGLG